ncbi:UNVERIFIED_CONTAM: hypothetical protein FKN15_003135 [Acipenser sinensis]
MILQLSTVPGLSEGRPLLDRRRYDHSISPHCAEHDRNSNTVSLVQARIRGLQQQIVKCWSYVVSVLLFWVQGSSTKSLGSGCGEEELNAAGNARLAIKELDKLRKSITTKYGSVETQGLELICVKDNPSDWRRDLVRVTTAALLLTLTAGAGIGRSFLSEDPCFPTDSFIHSSRFSCRTGRRNVSVSTLVSQDPDRAPQPRCPPQSGSDSDTPSPCWTHCPGT